MGDVQPYDTIGLSPGTSRASIVLTNYWWHYNQTMRAAASRLHRTSDLTDLGPYGPRTLDIWPHGPQTLDLGHLTSRASDTSRPRTSRTPSYEQQWQPQQILSSHSSQPIHAKQ